MWEMHCELMTADRTDTERTQSGQSGHSRQERNEYKMLNAKCKMRKHANRKRNNFRTAIFVQRSACFALFDFCCCCCSCCGGGAASVATVAAAAAAGDGGGLWSTIQPYIFSVISAK